VKGIELTMKFAYSTVKKAKNFFWTSAQRYAIVAVMIVEAAAVRA
jgi:hypothetical protein